MKLHLKACKHCVLTAILSVFFGLWLPISVFAKVKNIDNQELQLLLASRIPIIDIREEIEWKETGVIPGSHLITFFDSHGNYNLEEWLKKLFRITKREDPLIIICRSGRRSLILANHLSQKENFFVIYNVDKGIKNWKKENLDIQELP